MLQFSNSLLYTKLESQQKERTAFVADIAHELKTPLAAMKGYTGLLVKGMAGEMNAQQHQFIEIVHRNIEHMETLGERHARHPND